jgi:hypothetical protein
MASTLFSLMQTPTAYNNVLKEVRSAFADEAEITAASVSKLSYLTAAINEGMRLGPPSAIDPPRVMPKEGGEICGRWVPGGVSLAFSSIFFGSASDHRVTSC